MSRKIPKEVKALGGKFLPWPEQGINLRPPDGPRKGLRLSEDCGACCILDYFLERPSVVNDGVSMAGHMYADIFIQSLLEPVCNPQVEKEYQWAPKGWSGMDTVVDSYNEDGFYVDSDDSPYTGHYEYKTSSEDSPKPKAYNRRQVIRQRVVMARNYGITDAQLFNSYIFMIGKSGLQSGKVFGPFLVEPDAEELQAAINDIDLRIEVYQDIVEDGLENPYDHPLLKDLRRGTCTRCFPLEVTESTPELDQTLGGREEWDKWIQAEGLTKWQKEVKDSVKQLVPAGERTETDYFLVRHTESGRLYIDAKSLK